MPSEDFKTFQISKYVRRGIVVVVAGLMLLFFLELRPVDGGSGASAAFEIKPGEGFSDIANSLESQGLVRSKLAFEIMSLSVGSAGNLHPGLYELSGNMWSPEILYLLDRGNPDVTVTIPEGWNIFQIDKALSDASVISKGELVASVNPLVASGDTPPSQGEGMLFPDTYEFTNGEPIADVLRTFSDNFNKKVAMPYFSGVNNSSEERILTIASILEKEAPSPSDQSIIAGIIQRRISSGIMLDIDATTCYAKQLANPDSVIDCATLTSADFKIESPYNTYEHYGLPPGPIGNPGVSSIEAALHPTATPYLYYLSNPATGKIIYAKTLQEQEQNIGKYLR